jgi:hypothetical protein
MAGPRCLLGLASFGKGPTDSMTSTTKLAQPLPVGSGKGWGATTASSAISVPFEGNIEPTDE